MRIPPELQLAIEIWSRGEALPIDVVAALIALGFDVEALEAQYAQ